MDFSEVLFGKNQWNNDSRNDRVEYIIHWTIDDWKKLYESNPNNNLLSFVNQNPSYSSSIDFANNFEYKRFMEFYEIGMSDLGKNWAVDIIEKYRKMIREELYPKKIKS